MEDVASRLRQLREERGYSQNKLGRLADLNPATISLIEARKRQPNVETLQSIAGALGVEVRDFFPPKGEAPSPESSKDREGGVQHHRTSKSHAERITGSSHARVEVDVEALRAALHGVAAGWLTAGEAEEKLLVGV
jgi:putative transcriptional regulator